MAVQNIRRLYRLAPSGLTLFTMAIVIFASVMPLSAQRRGQRDERSSQPRIEPEDLPFDLGVAEIPDREMFERLSYQGPEVYRDAYLANLEFVKFCIDKADPDNPKIYFMNTNHHRAHPPWMQRVGISTRERGAITYLPRLTNPSGEPGLYIVDFEPRDSYSYEEIKRFLELLTEKMPILEGRVAFHPLSGNIARYESEKEKYEAGNLAVHLDSEKFENISYLPLNPAESFGVLRLMDDDSRPTSRDIVVYRTLPNQLPRVAGVITEVRQTPLSHVNLRAVQDKIPNAFIRNASQREDIQSLVGKLVHLEVTPQGFSLRAATELEVNKHFEAIRPTEPQSPVRNLDQNKIAPLNDIPFERSDSFGVKTANLASLRTIKMPALVPDGFGIPFYFYDEFMKHNGFYDEIDQMMALPEFSDAPDRNAQMERLDEFRTRIREADMPEWMSDAIAATHSEFPDGSSVRCRSSTNNEDLPGFSGAGLYDSYTHRPEEGALAESIKQVYASLWNFRAFEEREFYRIDHKTTAMGVLLHPNYKEEQANGVAVTEDILYGTTDNSYLNIQIGEDLVTNPDQQSSPEEILLAWRSENGHQVIRRSDAVGEDEQLLSDAHLREMRESLNAIFYHFEEIYKPGDNRFAIEIEFKIDRDGKLVIKQARPWVHNSMW